MYFLIEKYSAAAVSTTTQPGVKKHMGTSNRSDINPSLYKRMENKDTAAR